jgi:hypothetical protein
MLRLLKTAILILSLPVIYAFVVEAWRFFYANRASLTLNWMTYGFGLYVLLYLLVLRRKIRFLEIFEHELCHMVVAFLFLKRVDEFVVIPAKNDAHVSCHNCSNVFIGLAPYYLPVLTVPLLIIKPFMAATVHQTVDFFIGATLAFHFTGLCKEFRFRQPDIKQIGRFYAVVLAIFLNIVFIVLALSFALKKYNFMLAYSKQGFVGAWHVYQSLAGYVGRSFIFFTQVATSP